MGAGASLFLKRTPTVFISSLASYFINIFCKVSISIIGSEVLIIELREVVKIEQSRFHVVGDLGNVCAVVPHPSLQDVTTSKAEEHAQCILLRHWQV